MMARSAVTRLMVVDDNEVDREAVRRLVGREFHVEEAATAQEGLRLVEEMRPDCVLIDYRLPDASGVELVQAFAAAGLPVVMLSGVGSESVAVAALKGGAQDYLSKDGLSAEVLRVAVRGAIQTVALERQVREQQQALERHAAELARRSEELRILLDQLPAVVWTVDQELRVGSAQGRHLERLGLDSIVGARLPDRRDVVLGSPELVEQHRSALSGVPSRHAFQLHGRSYEAALEPVRSADGAVTGAIGLLQDTTERRRLEEQLRHSQKMEAMGRLAGGVAHDFNNLLTVIVNCAALAKETLSDGDPAAADMDEVLGAAQRAAELTGQLLAFSRRRTTQAVVVDVAKQLRSTTRMLERLIGSDVKLETHVAPDVAAVRIDPGALEQVVVNLAVNARDAMPGGGRLLVDVTRIEVDRGWLDFRGMELPPGSYVRVVVNDTGTGMSPEVRARLFEPFFSTKGPGRGTGLGLATVYGIVTQAGGSISVYSEPGRGTAFHVYLPRVGDAPTEAQEAAPKAVRGTETIVVVEDDPRIRAIAGRVLAEHGYKPIVASSAEEALGVLASDQRIDAMLTDVVMPGMPGDQLLEKARELRPGLKALLMSGYSPHLVRAEGLEVPMLQKPFTPTQLVTAVRAALDG